MAAILTSLPFQLSDGDTGLPLAFAQISFTLTGTTTATTVYADNTLCTPLANPVTADADGLFPTIYFDDTVQLRARGILDGGDFANPYFDIDPVNEVAAGLTADDISTALGYVPVDPAVAAFTGETRLRATNLTILHDDAAGYRGYPVTIKDASYTFKLDDAGRLLLHDDTSTVSWTIDTNTGTPFPHGTVIHVMNVNTGVVTLARESGVELRIAGSATSKDVALAQWGVARLIKYDDNKWMASGNGLS